MICSRLCHVEATSSIGNSDGTHNLEGEDISSNIEYMMGTFFDDMEDGDCIDLDYVLEDELSQRKKEEGAEDKKKEDVLKVIDSLNIDLGALGSAEKGSRLKRRPESPDITDNSDSQQFTQPIQIEGKKEKRVNSDSDSVLIISAIDGTLAGISRSSGQYYGSSHKTMQQTPTPQHLQQCQPIHGTGSSLPWCRQQQNQLRPHRVIITHNGTQSLLLMGLFT
jgi:hypothetical protein